MAGTLTLQSDAMAGQRPPLIERLDEQWQLVCEMRMTLTKNWVIERMTISRINSDTDEKTLTPTTVRHAAKQLAEIQRRLLAETDEGKSSAGVVARTHSRGRPLDTRTLARFRKVWKLRLELLKQGRRDYAAEIARRLYGDDAEKMRSCVRSDIRRAGLHFNTNASPAPAGLNLTGQPLTALVEPTRRKGKLSRMRKRR